MSRITRYSLPIAIHLLACEAAGRAFGFLNEYQKWQFKNLREAQKQFLVPL
jgi:hypothetical protein